MFQYQTTRVGKSRNEFEPSFRSWWFLKEHVQTPVNSIIQTIQTALGLTWPPKCLGLSSPTNVRCDTGCTFAKMKLNWTYSVAQVVISTGKSDWERDITEEEGSLAQHLTGTSKHHRRPSGSATSRPKKLEVRNPPGIFTSTDQSRLSILNGSHTSLSCTDDKESVLVFPDYKVLKEVPCTQEGSELLWRNVLDPTLNRAGKRNSGVLKSYPLQYACVILLCTSLPCLWWLPFHHVTNITSLFKRFT